MKNSTFRLSEISLALLGSQFLLSTLTTPASAQSTGVENPGVQLKNQISTETELPGDIAEVTPSPDKVDTSVPVERLKVTEPLFFFKAVRINGNTVFSDDELIQPFLPLIGSDITFADLTQAVLEAESAYKKAGYLTSRVILPAQDIKSGKIII